jgi:hypothetical protein
VVAAWVGVDDLPRTGVETALPDEAVRLGYLALLHAILDPDRCAVCDVRRATVRGRCGRCRSYVNLNGVERDGALF